jgi:hypothetical protein
VPPLISRRPSSSVSGKKGFVLLARRCRMPRRRCRIEDR